MGLMMRVNKKIRKNKPVWVKQIKGVGFDLDGTLYPANQKLNDEVVRLQTEEIARHLNLKFGEAKRRFDEKYKELGSSTKSLDALGVKGLEFFPSMWDEIPLAKYIFRDERLVKLVRRVEREDKRPRFLLSNSNRVDQMEKKINAVGIELSWFDVVVSTVDIGAVKPDPAPFLYALEKLEMAAEEVVYIGDKVGTDVEGALGVGMRTCLVGSESEKADVCAGDIYDALELIYGKEK